MKQIILSLIGVIALFSVQAQDCTAYIINNGNKVAEYVNKNKKGKTESYHSQKLLDKTVKDGQTRYKIEQIYKDKKGKEENRDTLNFYCENGVFNVDMSQYLNQEQYENYEETQISFDFENISYPKNMGVGTTLDDGSVTVSINTGMMTLDFVTTIENREVLAKEKVTTDAGTFSCLKISQDIKSKAGFVTITLKTISWITEGVGVVKSETYNSKDKLMGSSELIRFE
ncbi:MAG: hypothetical protein U9N85_08035 [Bacteroidota bacterium]|nr:hypothetical protein [Bacteroidota bacterium]